MSSDSTPILDNELGTVSIIGLGSTLMHGPYISDELVRSMREMLDAKKKVICVYNRRGSAHSYVCSDCGYQEMCAYCNISLSYHTTPSKRLICHQCSYTTEIYLTCPKCSGSNITPVGIGIQRVELAMRAIFPESQLVRIDSDAKKAEKQSFLESLDRAQIIIGTQMVLTTLHEDIGLIAFLLIDNDLAIPEFDREEKIYDQITYARRMGVPTIIQTYAVESDFVDMVLHGNYRTFLTKTLSEREAFFYPPYGAFVTIWVHGSTQDIVKDIIFKLVNKIEIIKSSDVFLSFDRDIWEKYAGEWKQKIVLKGKDLDALLDELRVELLRNRKVYIERH